MQRSIDLLDRALTLNQNYAEWCRTLGISRSTLHTAKARGRLSPTVAGNLARLLGEEETGWIALAALEGEPESQGKTQLLSRYRSTKKL